MSSQPSGWYEDPDDPSQLRYWDGVLWTEHRMPRTKPGLDASSIGTATPPSAAPGTQGAPASWGPQQPAQPWGQQAGQWGQPPATGYPYAPGMPVAAAPGGPVTPDGAPLSGWWRRFGALLIDQIILSAVSSLLSWPWLGPWVERFTTWIGDVATDPQAAPDPPDALLTMPWQLALISLVVHLGYETLMTARLGRTVGKMATGISVRAADAPRRLTLGEAGVRAAVKWIGRIVAPVAVLSSLASLFTLLDGLWPVWDGRKQALHDKPARSVVVVGPPPQGGAAQETHGYRPS